MRKLAVVMVLGASMSLVAHGKEPRFYQKGRLASMEAVSCGFAEKSGNSIMGEIVGTNGAHKNTKEMLCQEYVLRSERVVYRIRPRDEKHPVLLPIGEDAEFRIQKDKLYLRVMELDGKERDYNVISMTPVDHGTDAAAK